MPPTYSYLTFAQAKTELSQRLYDPTKQFWTDAELSLYLKESLRTWNALTGYWRNDFIFQTQPGVTWYDLTDAVNLSNTLRPFTVLDTELYTIIQYHLLEPPVGINPWTGASAQFSASDLLTSIQRQRDEILSTSGCTTTLRTVPAVAGRITLPDTVVDVRRMAYLPAVGSPSTMWPEDTWGEESFQQNYAQLPANVPLSYLMSTLPSIAFDAFPPPAFAGSYELLTVEAGQTLSITVPTLIPIPDDWTFVLKWNALADLLTRESNAKDLLRAKYCEARCKMGIALLSDAPALLSLRIGNQVLQVDSVRSADNYRVGWQAEAQKKPDMAFHSGLNLIGLASTPDAGPYSLTATVVQNAPLPANDAAQIQAGRDEIDAIIEYAQHIAAFKMGGSEFLSTMPLLQHFHEIAAIYNSKLKEMGEYTEPLYALSQRQERMAPRTDASVSEVIQ